MRPFSSRPFGRRMRRLLGPQHAQALLDQAMRVFRISTEITSLENPTAIPLKVVQALVQELGLPAASMVLEDPDTGELAYVADYGVPEAVKRMGFRAEGIAMSVFHSGQPHFVEDMGVDPGTNPSARPYFQAYACLPIRHQNRSFGLIFVNHGEPHVFSPTERNLLMTFANQTAIALESARLRRSERQRNAALAALANLGRDLARSLDQEDLMRVLERTLRNQFPSLRSGALWLQQEEQLHLQVLFGFGRQLLEPRTTLLPDAAILTSGDGQGPEPLPPLALLADLGLDHGVLPAGFGETHALAVPLRTPESLEGMIGLILGPHPAQLTEADLDFLRTLADRAALALHNARLYAASRRAAECDGLTQVLNHTTFLLRLSESLEACRRNRTPLALLMLDADHFKRCNDTYGHPFGDRVLIALASAIRLQVRQTDGVGRLGGEEFAVFLPGAPEATATQVAERIRLAMENLSLELPDGSLVKAPTVSLGIALAPQHATDPAELILRADEALYRAKAGGRNRVCVA